MENAVQALKTAAAVLIFVIAITVAFTMFSRAKTTADAVVKSQDKQEYLEAAELESTLYTSSDEIKKAENGKYNASMTTNGDRIVKTDDVISTIYRYNLEKYGVTLVNGNNGEVIARFDSATEGNLSHWNEYSSEIQKALNERIAKNLTIKENYNITVTVNLEKLYKISDQNNSNTKCGAPWYGNDKEIIKRINKDINKENYEKNGLKYEGKGLKSILDNANKIIEVVNTIDNSKYLNDGEGVNTKLLQEYQLPTIEVIYIIY